MVALQMDDEQTVDDSKELNEGDTDSIGETDSTGEAKLDLSSLGDLTFGPNWSEPGFSEKTAKAPSRGGSDRGRGRRDDRPRDRRPRRGGPPQGRRDRRPEQRAPFRPVVDVSFYPEDAPFTALVREIRRSSRTFELFEVTQLILQKPERFVVVVRPKPGKPGESEPVFHISVPDGLPFETEAEAVSHVFKHHLDDFFDRETVEVEPPKGSFQSVNRCSITGELLGPPNYHRYAHLEQEHHANNLAHMSFEKFQSRIESVRDEEVIQEWVKKMTQQTRYVYKKVPPGEEEAPSFDILDGVKHFLLSKHKDEVVHTSNTARFTGKTLELLPQHDLIRRSVEAALEHQRRFPLDTANHLRGRLRRLKFAVYKKGSKGVSYVCAVKRRFREPDQVFAEPIQRLIEFIDQHPNIHASRLPEEYLGIKPQAPAGEAEESPNPDLSESEAAVAQESVEAGSQTDVPSESAAPESTETPAPADVHSEAKAGASEDEVKLGELAQNLRWLVTEGYVVEYADGTLYASPPRTPSKAERKESADEEKEDEGKGPSGSEAEEEVAREDKSDSQTEIVEEKKGETAQPIEESIESVTEQEVSEASPEPIPEAAEIPSSGAEEAEPEEISTEEDSVSEPEPGEKKGQSDPA